ncbi:MAG TPA: YdeI/OmpD-associated family protein [Arenimonas sp.]|nr:YdeI/OmpD-associated family protein [Arenimonas sp.]
MAVALMSAPTMAELSRHSHQQDTEPSSFGESISPMSPHFFATPAEFRRWLQSNHESASELIVGFWKTGSGEASITWPESVDQALCFGWIDGVRRSIDARSYCIRFTPRKPVSIWSQVNIARFAVLKEAGLVAPAGEAAFARGQHRTKLYSYENEEGELSAEELARFKRDRKAWAAFEARPAWYRKQAVWKVISAKQAATRERRLAALIEDSRNGVEIRWQSKNKA